MWVNPNTAVQSSRRAAGRTCSECGKNVRDVRVHWKNMHSEEINICPHCKIVISTPNALKQHIQRKHEKVPCMHCGKLYGVSLLQRHIDSFLGFSNII